MKIRKLNPKMGFWRAKQGLSKHGILRPNWSHVLGKERNRRERRGKERRRGRRWRSQDQGQQGMETTLGMDFCMELWILYGSHGILRLVMVNSLSPNLGF